MPKRVILLGERPGAEVSSVRLVQTGHSLLNPHFQEGGGGLQICLCIWTNARAMILLRIPPFSSTKPWSFLLQFSFLQPWWIRQLYLFMLPGIELFTTISWKQCKITDISVAHIGNHAWGLIWPPTHWPWDFKRWNQCYTLFIEPSLDFVFKTGNLHQL